MKRCSSCRKKRRAVLPHRGNTEQEGSQEESTMDVTLLDILFGVAWGLLGAVVSVLGGEGVAEMWKRRRKG